MGTVDGTSTPEVVRAIRPLTDPDYTDTYEVDTSGATPRSPEQWARAMFEDAPAAMRWFLLTGWRVVLGLRLGPRHSPDYVHGWHVLDRATNSLTLETHSWFLSCRLTFRLHNTKLVFATYVRYDRTIGAVIWPPVSIIHNRTIPYLLQHAVRHTVA